MMHHRGIRSYVLRQGRMTERQQRALQEYLPQYQMPVQDGLWDFTQCFGQATYPIVEIGFGMGQTLVEMAARQPEQFFIGIEVHGPGVGSTLAELHEKQLNNLKVVMHDAVEVFERHIPDASLEAVHIFFPDPWPKKRHHKRRLIQLPFVQLIARKLRVGGVLHAATDIEAYAEHMLEVFLQCEHLQNIAPKGDYISKPVHRLETKFERRGERLGHVVKDLMFARR